jgi:hypothetical protein
MVEERKEIKSWDEVPAFASEKEEQAWWDEHEVSDELLEKFGPIPEGELPSPREKTVTRPRKSPTSVRMEEDLVVRLKELAVIKGMGYQTLLRQFVADRVYEKEKREGILKWASGIALRDPPPREVMPRPARDPSIRKPLWSCA